jgi:hypothetical protein
VGDELNEAACPATDACPAAVRRVNTEHHVKVAGVERRREALRGFCVAGALLACSVAWLSLSLGGMLEGGWASRLHASGSVAQSSSGLLLS